MTKAQARSSRSRMANRRKWNRGGYVHGVSNQAPRITMAQGVAAMVSALFRRNRARGSA